MLNIKVIVFWKVKLYFFVLKRKLCNFDVFKDKYDNIFVLKYMKFRMDQNKKPALQLFSDHVNSSKYMQPIAFLYRLIGIGL